MTTEDVTDDELAIIPLYGDLVLRIGRMRFPSFPGQSQITLGHRVGQEVRTVTTVPEDREKLAALRDAIDKILDGTL